MNRIGLWDAAEIPRVATGDLRVAPKAGTLRHVRVGQRRRIQTTAQWLAEWTAQNW
jgi:hypothetical protein